MAKDGVQQPDKQPEIGKWIQVPEEILSDGSIPDGAKLLYGVINGLSKKKGICWASNKFLAMKLGKSNDTISRWVSLLVKRDHISIKITMTARNKSKRLLSPHPASTHRMMVSGNDEGVCKNTDTPPRKNADTPLGKNAEPINTSLNKTREEQKPPSHMDYFEEKKRLDLRAKCSDGLTKIERARYSFLNAYLDGDLPKEFYWWFEKQVCGRYDIMCVTGVDLNDWHRGLFKKYGEEVATNAVSDRRIAGNTSHPGLPIVLAHAVKIEVEIKKQKRTAEAAAAEALKKSEPEKPKKVPYSQMEISELEKEFEKELNAPKQNKFLIDTITRRLNEKRTAIKGAGSGCKLPTTEKGLTITCTRQTGKMQVTG